jgi:polysaccharide biosynthesis/export protein
MRRALLSLTLSILLAGCSGEGPRDHAITGSASVKFEPILKNEPYAVIEVNKRVAERTSAALIKHRHSGFFKQTGPAPVVIGPGDTLSISIVSSSDAGFVDFVTSSLSPISTASLPPQEVSSDGTVNVPPLGRVLARGKTVQSFENFVRRRLGEVLVYPSVIVQLTSRRSARVTVIGAVQAPNAVPLSTTDTRLIDMITAAGGPADRTENLEVTLIRSGQSATLLLDSLYSNPTFNISALPGDVISVKRPVAKVTVLGAFTTNAQVSLEGPSVTLSQAIGQFGGFERNRAKLKGVYVYRETEKSTLAALGADVSGFPGHRVPTIFKFDFTEPTAFFIADSFLIADGDILYTTQSVLSEIKDVISALSPVTAAPRALDPGL